MPLSKFTISAFPSSSTPNNHLQPGTTSVLDQRWGDLTELKLRGCHPRIQRAFQVYHFMLPSDFLCSGSNNGCQVPGFDSRIEQSVSQKYQSLVISWSSLCVFVRPLASLPWQTFYLSNGKKSSAIKEKTDFEQDFEGGDWGQNRDKTS